MSLNKTDQIPRKKKWSNCISLNWKTERAQHVTEKGEFFYSKVSQKSSNDNSTPMIQLFDETLFSPQIKIFGQGFFFFGEGFPKKK